MIFSFTYFSLLHSQVDWMKRSFKVEWLGTYTNLLTYQVNLLIVVAFRKAGFGFASFWLEKSWFWL